MHVEHRMERVLLEKVFYPQEAFSDAIFQAQGTLSLKLTKRIESRS